MGNQYLAVLATSIASFLDGVVRTYVVVAAAGGSGASLFGLESPTFGDENAISRCQSRVGERPGGRASSRSSQTGRQAFCAASGCHHSATGCLGARPYRRGTASAGVIDDGLVSHRAASRLRLPCRNRASTRAAICLAATPGLKLPLSSD
jgi:hypothetical protein